MFGFSIQKLMVLAGIIGAVWYGFKLVGRLDAARRAQEGGGGKPGQGKPGGFADNLRRWSGRRAGPRGGGEAEEMVQCAVCGAYVVSRGATSCGRGDCPH